MPRKHGLTETVEHAVWCDMRRRCRNPNHVDFRLYGGRGITVCERWDSFENFLADVGRRPGKGYSIDRIDNDGNYEPGNCRWATPEEQSRNRRIKRLIGASCKRGHPWIPENIQTNGKGRTCRLCHQSHRLARP